MKTKTKRVMASSNHVLLVVDVHCVRHNKAPLNKKFSEIVVPCSEYEFNHNDDEILSLFSGSKRDVLNRDANCDSNSLMGAISKDE